MFRSNLRCRVLCLAVAAAALIGLGTAAQAAPADAQLRVVVTLTHLPGPFATVVVSTRNNSARTLDVTTRLIAYEGIEVIKPTITKIRFGHIVDKDTSPHWVTELRPNQLKAIGFVVRYNDEHEYCFVARATSKLQNGSKGPPAKNGKCFKP